MYLERNEAEVSELVSPGRATDLTGFPPNFVDVRSCEVFRDEAVAFALQLWKSGVSAELHVWPGGFHGFPIKATRGGDVRHNELGRVIRSAFQMLILKSILETVLAFHRCSVERYNVISNLQSIARIKPYLVDAKKSYKILHS